jgi:polyribonucleotide nucleotidyltransferase
MGVKIAGIKAILTGRLREKTAFIFWANVGRFRPRADLSVHAPPDDDQKRKSVSHRPGRKKHPGIIEKTGVKIDIDDGGLIVIASVDSGAARQAMEIIG